jgi:hypothetical protein
MTSTSWAALASASPPRFAYPTTSCAVDATARITVFVDLSNLTIEMQKQGLDVRTALGRRRPDPRVRIDFARLRDFVVDCVRRRNFSGCSTDVDEDEDIWQEESEDVSASAPSSADDGTILTQQTEEEYDAAVADAAIAAVSTPHIMVFGSGLCEAVCSSAARAGCVVFNAPAPTSHTSASSRAHAVAGTPPRKPRVRREKCVDTELVACMIERLGISRPGDLFVLISGDGDMMSGVERALKRGVRVLVMATQRCMSMVYTADERIDTLMLDTCFYRFATHSPFSRSRTVPRQALVWSLSSTERGMFEQARHISDLWCHQLHQACRQCLYYISARTLDGRQTMDVDTSSTTVPTGWMMMELPDVPRARMSDWCDAVNAHMRQQGGWKWGDCRVWSV